MTIREVIADALYRTQDLLDDDERAGHILSALDAAGLQVRPKEPTEAMIAAGYDAGGEGHDGFWEPASPEVTYRAMIAEEEE